MYLSLLWLRLVSFLRWWFVVDDSFFIVTHIVCGVLCLVPDLLCIKVSVLSSFATILIGERAGCFTLIVFLAPRL